MAAPYVFQIRTGGEAKNRLREIISSVANEFNLYRADDPLPVPHIALFGPYNADDGQVVKETVEQVAVDFDIVPYRIAGFGRSSHTNVIYANVTPTLALRDLRRELSRYLRPITYNYNAFESKYFYDYHITIAYDIEEQFEDIWEYVTRNYELSFDEYATRITCLRHGEMLWEYDLLLQQDLGPHEATSVESREQTAELLEAKTSLNDHDTLAPKPNGLNQFLQKTRAKLRGQW